jgi:hypothetical protein
MNKKLIGGLAAAAVLCMAAPAWADGGHGRGHNKHWHKHHVYQHPAPRHYVVREVWRPVPVYPRAVYPAYAAPAPGIHIVVPNLFIPFY